MNDYMGTLSNVPARQLTSSNVASMSGKRGRGKARVNKRQPRTYINASECVSYKLDDSGNKIDAAIFKPARKRGQKTRRTVEGRSAASIYQERLAQYGSNADVD